MEWGGAEGEWKRFSEQSVKLFDVLLLEEKPSVILDSLARILGEALRVDRSLIYDISFSRDHAHCLTEWIDPARPHITPTKATYPLALFRTTAELVRDQRDRIESHATAPYATLVADGAVPLLHGTMSIKSLLWYPFAFREDGYYLLAFNSVDEPHLWGPADLEFVRAATRHVEMALIKIGLIEERSRTEEAMFAAQKLESLGLLAGGVAHDFNNLMVGVISNTELVLRRIPPDSPLVEQLRAILHAGQRAADLAGQMLAYAGKGPPGVARVQVREVIDETIRLFRASFPDVRIAVTANEVPPIEGNRVQLEQVFMNLLVNGAEAIAGSTGTLAVRIGTRELDAVGVAAFEIPTRPPPGRYVAVDVIDTGTGMDVATIKKIFDPFFTTKFAGRGLGLSGVQGIVKHHGGAIRVVSAPGKGTTFTVLWPVATGEPASVAPGPVLAVAPDARGRTVLAIDDEPMVLSAVAALLEGAGYTCLTAVGGDAGLELFRAHATEIACVLVDLTMPAPGGREVLRQVRAVRPDLPIVVMSGYAEGTFSELRGAAILFLKKPFLADALISAVAISLRG